VCHPNRQGFSGAEVPGTKFTDRFAWVVNLLCVFPEPSRVQKSNLAAATGSAPANHNRADVVTLEYRTVSVGESDDVDVAAGSFTVFSSIPLAPRPVFRPERRFDVAEGAGILRLLESILEPERDDADYPGRDDGYADHQDCRNHGANAAFVGSRFVSLFVHPGHTGGALLVFFVSWNV
jgi:hypothetical protein